jgi:geranylgeranyl pyrophosphate synthase
MLHVARLVHDDILDNASTRRGIATAHNVYGKQRATFSANYIIGRAFINEFFINFRGRKISEFNNIRLY